ncbi:MAG: hypothetical protein ABFS56_18295 [Pseudomonadota bacterium]
MIFKSKNMCRTGFFRCFGKSAPLHSRNNRIPYGIKRVYHTGIEFDTALALDKTTLTNFIKTTQKNVWQKLKDIHGTPEKILERIANECDTRGLLDVIRKGVKDRGQHIRLAYFKPATTLNQTTLKHYNQNKLTVMRQVKFNTHQSIDMLLSLNGLPPLNSKTPLLDNAPSMPSNNTATENPQNIPRCSNAP